MGRNRQCFGHNKPRGMLLYTRVPHMYRVYSGLYWSRVYMSGQSFPGSPPGQISEPCDQILVTMFGSRRTKTVQKSPEWDGSQVKVGQFQFSMNFPEIMQYYARMRPGHLRLFDNKSEKLGQSQESSRWPAGENYRGRERILFFIFISLWYENGMWKLITLTNVVRRVRLGIVIFFPIILVWPRAVHYFQLIVPPVGLAVGHRGKYAPIELYIHQGHTKQWSTVAFTES